MWSPDLKVGPTWSPDLKVGPTFDMRAPPMCRPDLQVGRNYPDLQVGRAAIARVL